MGDDRAEKQQEDPDGIHSVKLLEPISPGGDLQLEGAPLRAAESSRATARCTRSIASSHPGWTVRVEWNHSMNDADDSLNPRTTSTSAEAKSLPVPSASCDCPAIWLKWRPAA